jgi:hypothetical protein
MGVQAGRYTYGWLHLPRWEVSLPVAREGHVQFLSIRMVCNAIGVAAPQKQFTVVHKRYSATKREVPFKIDRVGWRDFLSLPSDDVALWMASIRLEHCKITVRGPLEDFIADAKAALSALLCKPDHVPADRSVRGVVSHTVRPHRTETVVACDCGRHWLVISEGERVEVERINGDGGEEQPCVSHVLPVVIGTHAPLCASSKTLPAVPLTRRGCATSMQARRR